MKNAIISDITLRESSSLSFREKIDAAAALDRLGTSVIEFAPEADDKTDILFLRTIAPTVSGTICCRAGITADSAEKIYAAISEAKNKRLCLAVPTSIVQMEFMLGKKPAAVLELIEEMTKKCVSLCKDVECTFLDATRSEKDFLYSAVNKAVECGATVVSLCDSAGNMLPDEVSGFIKDVISSTDISGKAVLLYEGTDAMSVGTACAVAALTAGADGVKCAICGKDYTKATAVAKILSAKGDSIGVRTNMDITQIENAAKTICDMFESEKNADTPFTSGVREDISDESCFDSDAEASTIYFAIGKLGYDLSEDDKQKVYEEFRKIAENKPVSFRELDAIVATVALQVPSTYKLKSYVINNGNIITSTAHIELEKDGKVISGVSTGHGPVAAAFLAIEQIAGHHFELDDFQIQSLTQGREAVGSALVKLRSGGKLYSGKGVSADIIGASIKAYINALNKICFEEA